MQSGIVIFKIYLFIVDRLVYVIFMLLAIGMIPVLPLELDKLQNVLPLSRFQTLNAQPGTVLTENVAVLNSRKM